MLEILTVIGSLASIASLALQSGAVFRRDGTVDVSASVEGLKLTREQQGALRRKGAREIVAVLIIDEDLLSDIQATISKCIQRYRAVLKNDSKVRDKDVADRAAERCVCDALNRIKRRNDGELPPGDFERWWKSYRCVDDYDY